MEECSRILDVSAWRHKNGTTTKVVDLEKNAVVQ